jgi:hypothetical protein
LFYNSDVPFISNFGSFPCVILIWKSRTSLFYFLWTELILTCFQISKHYFQSFRFIHFHRKFNCGYATHFLYSVYIQQCKAWNFFNFLTKFHRKCHLLKDSDDLKWFKRVNKLIQFKLFYPNSEKSVWIRPYWFEHWQFPVNIPVNKSRV